VAAAVSDDPAKPAEAQSEFLAGKALKLPTGPNAPTTTRT